jgi:polar amino acid transport system substrate-binding protein
MSIARRPFLLAAAALAVTAANADAQPLAGRPVSVADAAKSLAPSGRLRVAINLGNGVLAQQSATGELSGVSVILARALADRLKLPLDMIAYPAAGQVVDAMDKNIWDMAFMAREPERAAKIDFSPAYVTIDGTYMVRKDSPLRALADFDKPGVRIAVGKGAAYDLFLSRTLKQAELRRAATSAAAVDLFMSDKLDAVAGVRQFLADKARQNPDWRVLDDSFQSIEQAIGVPHGHPEAAAYIRAFIEEMKASGMVRKALDATGQTSARVAPPA